MTLPDACTIPGFIIENGLDELIRNVPDISTVKYAGGTTVPIQAFGERSTRRIAYLLRGIPLKAPPGSERALFSNNLVQWSQQLKAIIYQLPGAHWVPEPGKWKPPGPKRTHVWTQGLYEHPQELKGWTTTWYVDHLSPWICHYVRVCGNVSSTN